MQYISPLIKSQLPFSIFIGSILFRKSLLTIFRIYAILGTMLERFTLTQYRLTLAAKEMIALPKYMGSTLRGGFGSSFKRIVCSNRKKNCPDCLLREKCIYAYIFETSPPEDSEKLSKSKDIPRPFIIEPPVNGKREYEEDELLEFDLTLIGRAIDYLPYFIVTFKELGSIGLGRGRGKYSLEGVRSEGKEIYSSKGEILKGAGERIDHQGILKEVSSYSRDRLSIDFITPTRMKFNKRYVSIPEFHVLIRSLLARISSLSYFHCGEELSLDFKGMIEKAKGVKIEEDEIKWVDWERYSSRQDARMNLGGIVGKATYKGDLEKFLPLIALGRYVHVGKGATFGLGRYKIAKSEEL